MVPRHVQDADDLPLTVPPADAPLPSEDEVRRWVYAYLRHAPLSLTLREINRLVAIDTVSDNKGTILDVG